MHIKHSTCVLSILATLSLGVALASNISVANISQCAPDHDRTIWKCNYIPQDIPEGFSRVDIEVRDLDIYCYNTSFKTANWQHVEYLKLFQTDWTSDVDVFFNAYCFRNLRNLKYLGINIGIHLHLSPDAFTDVRSVEILSMADCVRIDWDALRRSLDGTDKLPNLTDLDLSNVDGVLGPVAIGEKEAHALGKRNLTGLNLSGMQVSFLNFTALLRLTLTHAARLNLTSMNLNDFVYDGTIDEISHLIEVDLSYMVLPKFSLPSGLIKLYNLKLKIDPTGKRFYNMFYIRKVIADGTLSNNIFELYNCELILNVFIPMFTETINVRNNNFKHIDINVSGHAVYRNTTIKHVDLSGNGMDFLHPAILSLAPNLVSLKLSENRLVQMVQKNGTLFEKLFFSNAKLKILDLSTNGLEFLPEHLFIYNIDLEEINLSNNLLQQVHVELDNLVQLKILDVSSNRITILDSTSLEILNRLIISLRSQGQLMLRMENNPISCSKCESKSFITWLTTTSSVNLTAQKITCTQEDGKQGDIDELQVQHIKTICNRMTIILICLVTFGIVCIGAIILTYVLARRRKIRRHRLKQTELMANIQEGDGVYEFVAMLSYNNEDEEFIRQYVLDPLNNTLQDITGVDRDLVLTGDQHFRPGYMVHNEIASSLDRVSLVMLLITNEFCTSGYCLSELDQAWIHRKPILFMFKDDVNVNLMSPIMKTIYKKNVRILWTMEEDGYVLKTTWDNVCHAILELIIE